MQITVTLVSVCAGGEHLTFEVTGGATATVKSARSEMVEPITEEEKQAFVKILAKMARAGRTNSQARAILESGVLVSV